VQHHDWDAATYDRVAGAIKALGHEVLDRLELRGDETVLDAGCGPGEITEALADRLPRGRAIAVDASPRMAAAARARLGDRADVRVADLLELSLEAPVDAVLSSATFHWIADHDRLFARLRGALRPGGQLVAQCGGEGNLGPVGHAIEQVTALPRFAEHLAGFRPWRFAGPHETERRLRSAGFARARCRLQERPVTPDEPVAFFSVVLLGAHRERLPEASRDDFVAAVLARLPERPTIPFVRLDIDAVA
jgi:trans-aconitate 2-methyltransferase